MYYLGGFDLYLEALDLETNDGLSVGLIKLLLLEKLPPVVHFFGRKQVVIIRIKIALAAVSIAIKFT